MINQIGFFYDPADLIEWAYIIMRLEENGIDIDELDQVTE